MGLGSYGLMSHGPGAEPSAVRPLLIGTSFQSGFKFADFVDKADPE